PTIAKGDANKVWIVPSELNKALEGLGSAVGSMTSAIPAQAKGNFTAPEKIDVQAEIRKQEAEEDRVAERTMGEALAAAQEAERAGPRGDKPPVAEQLAVTAGGADGLDLEAAPERYPAQSEYTAGPNYATAYEPGGQPNSQR
ncbi:MAG TPA: hypothetical protein VK401_10105, partial [Propionibacteriaceae bacterium]|nr:hypothetical protein [Propionibacteriaceae bacterium]